MRDPTESVSDADREWIDERAAIREHEGGMSRDEAEHAAELDWRDTLDRDAERAKRELHEMVVSARRSLGQRVRYARQRVRDLFGQQNFDATYSAWVDTQVCEDCGRSAMDRFTDPEWWVTETLCMPCLRVRRIRDLKPGMPL